MERHLFWTCICLRALAGLPLVSLPVDLRQRRLALCKLSRAHIHIHTLSDSLRLPIVTTLVSLQITFWVLLPSALYHFLGGLWFSLASRVPPHWSTALIFWRRILASQLASAFRIRAALSFLSDEICQPAGVSLRGNLQRSFSEHLTRGPKCRRLPR
jgi:hypothetical protein